MRAEERYACKRVVNNSMRKTVGEHSEAKSDRDQEYPILHYEKVQLLYLKSKALPNRTE